MWFCVRDGREEWMLTPLEHGSVLVWSSHDDKSGVQHSVSFPASPAPHAVDVTGGRFVLVCRWLDTVREHAQVYPHCNVSGRECEWL